MRSHRNAAGMPQGATKVLDFRRLRYFKPAKLRDLRYEAKTDTWRMKLFL